jgi:hypothetical protein
LNALVALRPACPKGAAGLLTRLSADLDLLRQRSTEVSPGTP